MITESHWLSAADVLSLDLYRSARVSTASGGCSGPPVAARRWRLTLDARLDRLADAAEQFADGVVTWDELKLIRRLLTTMRKELIDPFGPNTDPFGPGEAEWISFTASTTPRTRTHCVR